MKINIIEYCKKMEINNYISLVQYVITNRIDYNTDSGMQTLCDIIARCGYKNHYSYCHINDIENFSHNTLCTLINDFLQNSNYRIVIKEKVNYSAL